jgi:RNA polymerase sigma factor (sigma-70 family)
MTNGPLAKPENREQRTENSHQQPTEACPPSSALCPPASDLELLDRFHRLRDQAAFEQLVRRHGPMVLSVCRRILLHAHDAEDAFQATFLVLVRKAGSLRNPELLANYLYGVAYRVARKARTRIARQSQCERQAKFMPAEDVYFDLAWQELRFLLDEELQRLPKKYQAPLVLCYLEGLSNEEAARKLGWPSGSISYRLAKGRELLRQRLARRDRAFSADLFASVLLTKLAAEQLPDALLQSTVQAALDLAETNPGPLPKATAHSLLKPVVVVLLILVFLGLATSVIANGFLDGGMGGNGLPSPAPSAAGGSNPGADTEAAPRTCH